MSEILKNEMKIGVVAALSAYVLWGFLPVYWKSLSVVPSAELLAWRVGGAGIIAWLFVLLRKRPLSRSVFNMKAAGFLLMAAVLISCNWGLYLWAISTGRIVEASLGYYINPLINVLLGVFFFSERMGRIRYIAIFLASAAVILMTLDSGLFPWLSLVLAFSFGFYGLAVKHLSSEIDSIEVLAWETLLVSPLAIGYLVSRGIGGELHFTGFGTGVTVMLVLAGLVTLLPLWLFGVGAKRIPLSTMGFLQYLAPTIMLLLGVLVYGEYFGLFRGIAFSLVAAALVLYSTTLVNRSHS
ncbi:MAG: EamA family transporter RarD [Spirochaetes bacterium]|nr:MAG: EamA family transporter RarD [Spirochaetota bacterium]